VHGEYVHVRIHPRFDVRRRKSVAIAVASEHSVLDAEPQLAFVAAGQARDHLGSELGKVGKVEHPEFNSVETHEPFWRAETELSVAGMGDGIDAVCGKSVLTGPALAIVLEDRPGGIERKEGPWEQDKKSKSQSQFQPS